jgi:ectoine hydroxylase-related dioxygenase (phytanoyl-CoA dioxygenase family)
MPLRDGFWANGYSVLKNVFSMAEVSDLKAAICDLGKSELIGQAREGHHTRISNLTGRHPSFRTIATEGRVPGIVAELIGRSFELHHTKLHRGSPPVSWHRDLCSYPHTNAKVIACELYLDPVGEEHGAVVVLPCSHHSKPGSMPNILGELVGQLTNEVLEGAEVLAAEPGDITVHHSMIVHRALPCVPGVSRDVLIFVYRAGDSSMLVPNTTGELLYGEQIGTEEARSIVADTSAVIFGAQCVDAAGNRLLSRRRAALRMRGRTMSMM